MSYITTSCHTCQTSLSSRELEVFTRSCSSAAVWPRWMLRCLLLSSLSWLSLPRYRVGLTVFTSLFLWLHSITHVWTLAEREKWVKKTMCETTSPGGFFWTHIYFNIEHPSLCLYLLWIFMLSKAFFFGKKLKLLDKIWDPQWRRESNVVVLKFYSTDTLWRLEQCSNTIWIFSNLLIADFGLLGIWVYIAFMDYKHCIYLLHHLFMNLLISNCGLLHFTVCNQYTHRSRVIIASPFIRSDVTATKSALGTGNSVCNLWFHH